VLFIENVLNTIYINVKDLKSKVKKEGAGMIIRTTDSLKMVFLRVLAVFRGF